jgi:putative membrane protein
VTPDEKSKGSAGDYFAAERTFLAWIRTGLALMGFGFVVARFGLFLEELQAVQFAQIHQSTGLSLWFGTALIVLGVAVDVISIWRYRSSLRELAEGQTSFQQPSALGITVAAILALFGTAIAVYLLWVRATTH